MAISVSGCALTFAAVKIEVEILWAWSCCTFTAASVPVELFIVIAVGRSVADKTAGANIEDFVFRCCLIWFYTLAFALFVVPDVVSGANALEASACAEVNVIIKSDWAGPFIASAFSSKSIVELFATAFLWIRSPITLGFVPICVIWLIT